MTQPTSSAAPSGALAEPLRIYVGYDPREDNAYQVYVASLLAHASVPVIVRTLDERALRSQGLFWRPQRKRPWGGGVDLLDGKPFSTEFSFTRFLIPFLQHSGWALCTDLDMLWRADVAEVFARADPRCVVQVVKHYHEPLPTIKMDGVPQERYPRKNWSSFVLWNCAHEDHASLRMTDVNSRPGSWLHGFRWLSDSAIGSLPERWNWLCGHSNPDINPAVVHFTRGTPDMLEWSNEPYADEWRAVLSGARTDS